MDYKKLSIIIPAYAEEQNLPKLLNEIVDVFIEVKSIEIVIVDDGSPISLNEVIKHEKHECLVKVITNKYNLGQSKSIEVGLKNSTGQVIGLIDADCQNPPSELKKLYDFYILNNVDAVISFRKNRKDEFLRKLISRLANKLLRIFTKSKFKDLGSSLKIIRRDCLESLTFKGDMHRFISPMLQARGYSIVELEVEHLERTKGVSKYGFGRIVPVIVDGILFYLTEGFTRPAKYAIGRLSLILFSFSIFFNCIVLYQKIVHTVFVHRNPLFILSMVFLLLSIQVFSQIVKVDQ
jgi:glycosyltransferase involved in cell wall biosynthesis